MEELLAEGTVKRFGGVEVLAGLSVRAYARDVIARTGSSGSVRSTFLRCLNLLGRPDDGSIVIGGDELKRVRDGASLRRSRIAMLLQHFPRWAHMTALANVIEAAMHVLGLSWAEALERAQR